MTAENYWQISPLKFWNSADIIRNNKIAPILKSNFYQFFFATRSWRCFQD